MNRKTYTLTSILVLGFIFILTGCQNAKFFANKGNESFVNGDYEAAISNYQNAVAKGDTTADTYYQIAESYRLSNRIQKAEDFYQKAIEGGTTKPLAPLYYGMSLKSNGEYDKAVKVLDKYQKNVKNRRLKKRASYESKKITKIKDLPFTKWIYNLTNASHLNSAAEDYAPSLNGEELIFASSRGEGEIYGGSGYGFSNLYKTEANGSITTLDTSGLINSINKHEASATFSPDGKIMVFARSNSGSKKEDSEDVDLYMSRKNDDGSWSEPSSLPLNQLLKWEGCPLFSKDGKRLYFVSDRKGGRGGLDLWVSGHKDGQFSSPKNMGKTYNTFGNEMFPYIHEDGSFFFASDGHVGYGGMDLFKVVAENGKPEGKPINLGKSINTAYDDFGIVYTEKKKGYVCSNREGGQGSDDIYSFTEDIIPFYYLDLEVKGGSSTLNHAGIALVEDGNEVEKTFSDENGHYRHRLHKDGEYEIKVAKDSFFTASLTFTLDMAEIQKNEKNEDGDYVIKEYINLKRIGGQESYDVKELGYGIQDILFDISMYDIRSDASKELDKLIVFLQDNPGITIELGSHTDSRDSESNNLTLSSQRATSTVDYLTKNGNIEANRISAKGYGESKLINKCRDGVTCTEEEHQANRRTEIKILGVKNVNNEKYEQYKLKQEKARLEAEQEVRHEQMEEEYFMIEELKRDIAVYEKSKKTQENDPNGYKAYTAKKQRLAKIEKHFHELEAEENKMKEVQEKAKEKEAEEKEKKYLEMEEKYKEMERKLKELEDAKNKDDN